MKLKVGLYKTVSVKDEEKAELEALYNHPDVAEVVLLEPGKMHIEIETHNVRFYFDDKLLNKDLVDIVISRSGFSSVPTAKEMIKYCRRNGIKVFDNNLTKVNYLINKRADMIKLASAGLPVPKTFLFLRMSQLEEYLNRQILKFPIIMKQTNTGQGSRVFKVNSLEDIHNILIQYEKKISAFLLQEVVDYLYDLRIIVAGNEYVGCMRRIPKEGDFRANFSLGGSVEKFDPSEEIKHTAIKAAQACELLVSGVDILITKDGKFYVIEANRTPGLEGISKAAGKEIAEKVIDFMIKNAN